MADSGRCSGQPGSLSPKTVVLAPLVGACKHRKCPVGLTLINRESSNRGCPCVRESAVTTCYPITPSHGTYNRCFMTLKHYLHHQQPYTVRNPSFEGVPDPTQGHVARARGHRDGSKWYHLKLNPLGYHRCGFYQNGAHRGAAMALCT